MAIKLTETGDGKVLEIHLSGKLAHEDYLSFVPTFERMVQEHGRLRVVVEMTDFHGWEIGALWDETKVDIKYMADIERLAMVGNKEWEKQLSLFFRPFITTEIRYFESTEMAEARTWVASEYDS